MLYYIVFIVGVILAAINDKKKYTFKVFVVLLMLFAFFRYGLGTDYFSYEFLYSRLDTSVIGELLHGLDNQEIGFRFIGSLIKSFGISYHFYLVIIAFITILFVSKICSKYSKNPTLSLVLYFCFFYLVWTFSGLRQGLTMAIGVFYLLKYMQKQKHLRFILIVIALSLIHYSALILLPLYLASKIDFKKRTLIILTICSVLISAIPISNILSQFSYIPIIARVLYYTEPYSSVLSILDFQSIGRLVFLIIAFFYYETYSSQSIFSKKLINIYIVGFIIYFAFSFSELTAARLAVYGRALEMVILANVYYIYKERINKVLYIAGLLLLLVLYLNKELMTLAEQTKREYKNGISVEYINIFNQEQFEYDNRYYKIIHPDT